MFIIYWLLIYWFVTPLKVDNQLPGSMFPVVFHPVAPPKSIALDSGNNIFNILDAARISHLLNRYSFHLSFFLRTTAIH